MVQKVYPGLLADKCIISVYDYNDSDHQSNPVNQIQSLHMVVVINGLLMIHFRQKK